MKNLFLVFLAFCSFQFSQAQSMSEPEMIMLKAKNKLFERGIKQFDFNIGIVNSKAGLHQTKKGSLTASENKYHLELKLDEVEIFFDGTTKWTILTGDEEISISDVSEEDEDISFSKYFEDYKTQYTVEGKDLLKGKYKIILTPKSKEDESSKIEIIFNNYEIVSITNYMKNSTISTVTVTNTIDVSTAEFAPNMANYSSFEINDLR